MKVVINKCYGGFNLSNKAVERCLELGMTLTEYCDKGYKDKNADFVLAKSGENSFNIGNRKYYAVDDDRNSFRCDPRVVQVVEELGKNADGFCAELGIVEIPFDSVDGWEISEYDGYERIEQTHESWG